MCVFHFDTRKGRSEVTQNAQFILKGPTYFSHSFLLEINECEGCPCNNGVCLDLIADYECFCYPGFNISTQCLNGKRVLILILDK